MREFRGRRDAGFLTAPAVLSAGIAALTSALLVGADTSVASVWLGVTLLTSALIAFVGTHATWPDDLTVQRVGERLARVMVAALLAIASTLAFATLRVAVTGTSGHTHGLHSAGGGAFEHAIIEASVLAPVVVVVALLATPVTRAVHGIRAWTRELGRSRRRMLIPIAAAIGGLVVGLVPAVVLPASAAVPATPACTAQTAVRAYDVAAVHTFIPYSRWSNDTRVPEPDPVDNGVDHLTDGDADGLIFVLQRDKLAVQNWHVPIVGTAADGYAGDVADGRRLRPRPLVLRANVGECVAITVTNELDPDEMPGYLPQVDPRVSLRAFGVSYNPGTAGGASVGYNPDASIATGDSHTYFWVAPQTEGMYMFRDEGMTVAGVDDGGAAEHGLYGALAVEPHGARWFDPVTGRELSSSIPDQQYAAVADQSGDLYVDAVIADSYQRRFRESVLISQDVLPIEGRADLSDEELALLPEPFERFGINYGSDPEHKRIDFNVDGDERWCEDCSSEETALSSWMYGDPGMVKLASDSGPWLPEAPDYGGADPLSEPGGLVAANIEDCGLMLTTSAAETRPASCYVTNVTRAYQGDPIKLRFGHAGNYETHVFHLHAHTWPAEPDDAGPAGTVPPRPTAEVQPRATTIDSKTYSPWTAFTADLNYGAGARVGTVGDSIFHCHLYTHFSHGFWALMRVHDVLEDGGNALPDGTRVSPWAPLSEIGAGLGLAASVPPPKQAASFDIPGYPRFIPGEWGARAPQPPLSVWQREFDTDGNPVLDGAGNPVEQLAKRLTGTAELDPALLEMTQNIATDAVTGSLTLEFAGDVAAVALPASADDVRTAIEGMTSVDRAEVLGIGTEADPWRIRLLAWRAVADLTIGASVDPPATASSTPSAGFDPTDAEAARIAHRLAVEQSVQLAYHDARGTSPVPGAPLVDPCPTDARVVTYRVSIIQLPLQYTGDAPDGWRDVQGRMLVADEDVNAVLSGQKKPEPFFYRVNSGDCIDFELTNRTPNVIGDDAYQQLIMTNMAGSHIHLVNFDVLASDGASNGWNYQQAAFTEDQAEYNRALLDGEITCEPGERCLPAMPVGRDPVAESEDARANWLSNGQTIKERWFADYELRTVFTHDHHFAGSQQNRGLFSALIVEPVGFDSRHPYTGEWLQPINQADNAAAAGQPVCVTACIGRAHGAAMDLIGPSSPSTTPDAWTPDDFREFGVAIADFVPLFTASATHADILDPLNAIEPPRQPLRAPEGDQGGMAINYRAAPLIDRQFAGPPPAAPTSPGVPLTDEQLAAAGWVDPAYAFSSRVWGDPDTPILRANRGDTVRYRLIQGSHEEMHNFTVHGLRWKNDQADPASPYINARPIGVSEAFNIEDVAVDCGLGSSGTCFWPAEGDAPRVADFMYGGPGVEDLWFGVWGIMRVFDQTSGNGGLLPLPDNNVALPLGNPLPPPNPSEQVPQAVPTPSCPIGAPVQAYSVTAIDHEIVYNRYGDHDPYGLAYVLTEDVEAVRSGAKPLEPLVLRVNEGDCVEVTLHNEVDWAHFNQHGRLGTLDGDSPMPLEPVFPSEREPEEPDEEPGDEDWRGVPWVAGNRVSLHPSLLRYDVRTSDGTTVGYNFDQTAGPGQSVQYTWFADEVTYQDPNAAPALTDGELGVVPLLAYGDVRGTRHHGLLASIVVGPRDALYHDPITGERVHSGVQVDVDPLGDGADYRDAAIFLHNGLNIRNAAGEPVLDPIIGDWPDKGERAINYRNAPIHHRLGLPHPIIDKFADPAVDPVGPPFTDDGFGQDLANIFRTTYAVDVGAGPQPLGDPDTPIVRAYQGDPLRVHVLASSDRARTVQFAVQGHNWLEHAFDAGSVRSGVQGSIATGSAHTLHMEAAGGALQAVGDYRYGVENGTMGLSAGSWGLVRVYQQPAPGTERTLVPLAHCQNPYLGCNPLRVLNESLTTEPGIPALEVTAVPDTLEVQGTSEITAVLRLGTTPIGPGREVAFTWMDGDQQRTELRTTDAGGSVDLQLTVSSYPPGGFIDVAASATVTYTDGRPSAEVLGGARVQVIDPNDGIPPEVTGVTPPNDAEGVLRSAVVMIDFSELVDPASLDGAVRLTRVPSGVEVDVAIAEIHLEDPVRSSVTLTPSSTLRSGQYHVEVDDTVVDLDGNALVEPFLSTFTVSETNVSRIGGADRFETAALVSASRYPMGADTVFVANGLNYPDALAGGSAASSVDAPILLALPNGAVPAATVAELSRLSPRNIVVLGGPGAVSDAVLNALRVHVPPTGSVTRIAGDDRFETAVRISQAYFSDEGPTRVYLASGVAFPDALAGAAIAAQLGAPVLLSLPTSLPAVTLTELQRLAPDEVVILGGTAAVSDAVAAQAGAALGLVPQRLAGPTRYETAAAISAASIPDGPRPVVYVATGANFPDALAAAPIAGHDGAPIILIPPSGPVALEVLNELRRLDPISLRILGGEGAVSESQVNLIRAALNLPASPGPPSPPL
ncbi:cell wall-binding repeat-containing protein [Microbacterium lacus]|uniref:cell wall-binding repeat-containing protein n=1 Tax=Microbacterium lacus TaxID=415217 RepID=UPI003850D64C